MLHHNLKSYFPLSLKVTFFFFPVNNSTEVREVNEIISFQGWF